MMKTLFLLVIFLSIFCVKDFAQAYENLYSSLTLSDSLKKDANAVYRLDEEIVDITSPSNYTENVHQIITLLNDHEAGHLNLQFPYNKYDKNVNIEINVFDETGGLINKYRKKDFESSDYNDDMSLYIDEKLLHLNINAPEYPCTIEIIYQNKITGYVAFPDWYINSPNEAVENSNYIVKVPTSMDIKYHLVGINLKPVIDSGNSGKIYTWNTKNILAVPAEENTYKGEGFSRIEIAPQKFEYDNYKGECKSWQSLGAWNYQFYEEKDSFNEEQRQRINSLVVNCKTDRQKIEVLYDFLKKAMRYVSVQLGIGGFKPFPVQYVDDKKYGDCKALTNYMRYMLKVVGIRSYPALINSGQYSKPVEANFPSDHFDHVILCVPFKKDSVWLECTSNNNNYGFLGAFTENRNALLLTENGGILIATPKSDYKNNVIITKNIVEINKDGSSKILSAIYCSGDFKNIFCEINKETSEEQKNIFINYLKYKTSEEFELINGKDSADGKLFQLKLSYDQLYDFKAGNKLFFTSGITKLCKEVILPDDKRKCDYVFEFPYLKKDTTIFILPEGIDIERLPAKVNIETKYGNYMREFIKNETSNIVTIVSQFSITEHTVPANSYNELADFFRQANENENEKFILGIKK